MPHSPGPWTWFKHGDTDNLESAGEVVLSIYQSHGGGTVPVDADAHLIAAAPDLLAAVQSVVAWFNAIDREQHERTVVGQTLESASRNWDLPSDVPSLDIQPLKDAIAKADGQ